MPVSKEKKVPDLATEKFEKKTGERVADPQPIKQSSEGSVIKDQFYVSDEERTSFGIRENEQLKWVRNPRNWSNVELKDRIREIQHQCDGARPVIKDGELVTLGDMALVAVPDSEQKKLDAKNEEERKKFQRFHENKSDLEELPQRWRTDDPEWQKDTINEMLRVEYERNVNTGLIGPTQGVDWRTMMSMPGAKERYEREFEQNALRGMTSIQRDEVQKQQQTKRGKLFAMGAHLKNGKVIRD